MTASMSEIRDRSLERTDQKWKTIADGQAIGHEKIDAFPPVTAKRVRLHILSSTEPAHIREFQLYNWAATAPR